MLDTIAQIDRERVITTSSTVKRVVDLVSPDIWRNPEARILDPFTKGGEFLRECARRLWKGLEKRVSDEGRRRRIILHDCLYGLPVDDMCGRISRRTLYCAEDATNRQRCIEPFSDPQGNVVFRPCSHDYDGRGVCRSCGCKEGGFSDMYAYPFLHMGEFPPGDWSWPMKFDLVIGNPPYQLGDRSLYDRFWQRAVALAPKEIVMVVPARWYAGGKGLDDFRKSMLEDVRVEELHDFPDASECFPDNSIAGGVCFLKWKKNWNGGCLVTRHHKGRKTVESSRRPLLDGLGLGIFIRKGVDVGIASKVASKVKEAGDSKLPVSPRKPFGLQSKEHGSSKRKNSYRLLFKGPKWGWISPDSVKVGRDLIGKWKIALSKANGAGVSVDRAGKRSIFSTMVVLGPDEVCTETYLVIGPYGSKKEARWVKDYLDTKFVRYLVGIQAQTQNFRRDLFSLVPDIGYKREWTDRLLYDRYDLSEEERAEIENSIKPRAQS